MTESQPSKLHYGWVIVAVSTLALIVSNGLAIGGIPVFSKGIRDDFVALGAIPQAGAESFIANCSNITFLMSGLFSMLGGWLIARAGLRMVMVIGCVCLGVALLLHSQAQTGEMAYVARFLMGASLGFVGVAPNVVLVSNWFQTSRGTALGIVLTGTSLGGVLIPLVASPLITAYNWRTAMLAVSMLVWVMLLPAILFFVREKPVYAEADAVTAKTGLTLAEAVRTPLFWIFGLCAAAVFYPIFVTSQQFILYLQSPKIGLSLQAAAFAQSALFAVSIGGKFLAGAASDKISPTRVMFVFGIILFASTLVLVDLTANNAILFLIPFGLGYGGIFVLLQRMTADYFGLKEYGKILGTITLIEIIGATIGGRVTGYLADRAAGDYTTAFYIVIAASAIALACVAALNVLNRKTHHPASEASQ